MSANSGFSTKQLEQKYNKLLGHMFLLMQQGLTHVLQSKPVDAGIFKRHFTRIYKQIQELDKRKQQQPHFSQTLSVLEQILKHCAPESESSMHPSFSKVNVSMTKDMQSVEELKAAGFSSIIREEQIQLSGEQEQLGLKMHMQLQERSQQNRSQVQRDCLRMKSQSSCQRKYQAVPCNPGKQNCQAQGQTTKSIYEQRRRKTYEKKGNRSCNYRIKVLF